MHCNSDGNERQAKIILSFGIRQNYSLYQIPIEIVFFFIYLPWSKQWNMPKLSAASSIECKLSHWKRGKRAKHWQEDSWAVTSSNQSKNERRILLVVLVAEFLLLKVAEFLFLLREDDTKSWDNFLVYFQISCQPKGLRIHIYKLLASQAYAKTLV